MSKLGRPTQSREKFVRICIGIPITDSKRELFDILYCRGELLNKILYLVQMTIGESDKSR